MQDNKIRCCRCSGRKKVYKVANGYSIANFGGKEITCPFCNGDGVVAKLEDAVKEISEITKKKNKEKTSEL